MNKFLLFALLTICFLVSVYLFGRNSGESRRDYCILWIKSSLLTSFALSIMVFFEVSESPLELNLADYLVSYFISLVCSLIFMGGATYFLSARGGGK